MCPVTKSRFTRIIRLAGVGLCAVICLSSKAPLAQGPGAGRVGTIRGRIDLRRVAPAAERRPTVASLGAPLEQDRSDRSISVVYLQTAPRGAFEQTEPVRGVMDQRNETFVPHVLAITAGTTVE